MNDTASDRRNIPPNPEAAPPPAPPSQDITGGEPGDSVQPPAPAAPREPADEPANLPADVPGNPPADAIPAGKTGPSNADSTVPVPDVDESRPPAMPPDAVPSMPEPREADRVAAPPPEVLAELAELKTIVNARFDELREAAQRQDERTAERNEALEKQIAFVPGQVRLISEKVSTLGMLINEAKYKELLKDVLGIYDLVDQVLRGMPDIKGCTALTEHRRNYEVLATQLLQTLAMHDLSVIPTDGEFDPKQHRAMGKRPTDDAQLDNRIAEVRRKGFRTEAAVLRFAEVDVYRFEKPEHDSKTNA